MKNWTSTREAILAAPIPPDTDTYTAIPHSVFLDEVTAELNKRGYEVAEERFLTSDNCKVITGVLKIASDETELAPAITMVNSYNKKRRAEIRASAMVLVCKNGMCGISDNGFYSRKHTGTALDDFREHVKIVIDGLEKEFQRLKYNVEEMKAIVLNSKTRATLIGDMFINEGLLTAVQVTALQKEIRKPTSDCFSDDTLWSFYNNCTQAMKNTHPMYFDKQHVKFHTYICDKFKLQGSRGLFEALPEYLSTDAEVLNAPIPDLRVRLEDDNDIVEIAEQNEYLDDSEG